jgi:hypothetical protein
MTIMHRGAICWQKAQPGVLALLLGLILGPIISNNLGWQMTSGAARAAERAAIIEQAALICEQRARDDVSCRASSIAASVANWRRSGRSS